MSDYLMIDVARSETINGTEVPIDSDGHYLNADDWDQERGKARALTSPYGSLQFGIGTGEEDEEDLMFAFDHAELPDGKIVLHSIVNSDTGGYIEDDCYVVLDPVEAIAYAQQMVDTALERLAEAGLTHDAEGWNQSPAYFVASVFAHVIPQQIDAPRHLSDINGPSPWGVCLANVARMLRGDGK